MVKDSHKYFTIISVISRIMDIIELLSKRKYFKSIASIIILLWCAFVAGLQFQESIMKIFLIHKDYYIII